MPRWRRRRRVLDLVIAAVMLAMGAGLIGELDQRVAAALSQELGGRRVWLQLDTIESFESAQRYVRIHAAGLADFGLDGSTPARVEGLYDRGRNAWLRVNYELGGPVPMSGG